MGSSVFFKPYFRCTFRSNWDYGSLYERYGNFCNVSIFLPPNSSIVMSALPENRRGIASGTVATARNIGMMVGVSQAGLIFNMLFMIKSGGQNFSVYHKSMEPYFMAAFRYAMLSGAFLASIGIFIAFMRGSDKKNNRKWFKIVFTSSQRKTSGKRFESLLDKIKLSSYET